MAEKSDKPKGEKRFDIEEDLSKVEIPDILPVLPLRGIVIFPSQIHPFLVSRAASLKLIDDVGQAFRIIGLAAQKNPEEENPGPEGVFQRGTAVRILKMLKYPDQSVRVLVQGLARIDLLDFTQREPYFTAQRAAAVGGGRGATRKSTRCRRIWSASFRSSSRWCHICPTSCR